MGRKCSLCGNIGHNSRTCTYAKGCNNYNDNNNNINVGGLRLFGVQLDIISTTSSCSSPSSSSTNNYKCSSYVAMMKKSLSFDCLSSSPSSPPSSRIFSISKSREIVKTFTTNGYLSDGLTSKTQEKRKGVQRTEEEHMKFLVGLEKLGKGDWRGISRKFVSTRTPTQVASHAQKYFLRQTSLINHKKRRSSLFDMTQKKANHDQEDEENGHSLIDLNSFGDEQEMRMIMMTSIKDNDDDNHHHKKCKAPSNHLLSISLCSQESLNSSSHQHMISSKSSNSVEALDLDLALGSPKDEDKTKPPSSTSILLGPISVT